MNVPLHTVRLCLTSTLARPCKRMTFPGRLVLGKSYGSALVLHQRFYNTHGSGQGPVQRKLIYEGPLAKTAKSLKRFSIASLSATVLLAPLIMTLDSGLGMEIRAVLAGSVINFDAIDTLSPAKPLAANNENTTDSNIAMRSESSPASPSADTLLQVETLDFFGRPKVRSVFVHDLERSNRVFTVWKVKDQVKSAGVPLTPWGQTAPYAPAHTMFFAHEEGHRSPQMSALFDIVSGKAASLQGRAQVLQQHSNNAQ
ncbi:hypothetical protein IWQ62_000553 [Dispira parvispora]|uniref:Uncharacterized protein n=1 Tax=Dispira parvispora TaxID=1520584 RepID=A0A9W8AWT9_9FUNG|nr:hypothetical protein IWQ62_000553 [Dispira parvispora]